MSFLSAKDIWRLDQKLEAIVPDCFSPVGHGSLGTRLILMSFYLSFILFMIKKKRDRLERENKYLGQLYLLLSFGIEVCTYNYVYTCTCTLYMYIHVHVHVLHRVIKQLQFTPIFWKMIKSTFNLSIALICDQNTT